MPGDCSGKLAAIFLSCGVAVHRTTARVMAMGKEGWNFPVTQLNDMQMLALSFFTLTSARENGHVSIIHAVLADGTFVMAHASVSMGFSTAIIDPNKNNYWARNWSTARQAGWSP